MKLNTRSFKEMFFKNKKKIINYDFYPNHISIIEKPYSPYIRYIALTLSVSVIIFILWSYLGKLDIQAPATGKLIVSGYSQHIQIYEHSRLVAIHVENGQYVNQGAPLLTLDILGIDEEIKGIENKIKNLLALKIRYQALSQNTSPHSLYHFNILDKSSQKNIFLSYKKEKEEYDSNINHINSDIEINHRNQSLIKQELSSLNILKINIEERFKIRTTLYNKKTISKMEYLESEKELLDINKQIKTKSSEMTILIGQERQLNEYLEKTEKQKALEWHDKYKQYESEIVIYRQNLNHSQKRQQLKFVRSPVEGTVQQLSIHTLGAVLQPSQTVMVIVPKEQKNIAEVNILNKDIGFIYPGQKAIIKLDAFPYTRYGTIEGEIINIAKDSIQHEELGLVYPALIELNKQFININNTQYKLTAGMSLVADIIIDQRRIIDYLLSPIEVYKNESLRER
ncbi:HlyD family type I secretion periplasmic adaptor subunit [Proteus hauseri]|uniref:HlyD family type I secretion periplasmic adaptor subunit n=1 Tax=Proteus hauseri TaxID=183417 RepID=UPI0010095913|nr:HlyD family type I secretion periplasmic adaptor subunit [Proteus hauseri]QAV22204.1 HlyD family type I secretion periplasmic adaptor subunit [Proteus hauseri]